MKARFMNRDFIEFPSTWTITLLVNHRPIITGTDKAIWRRVRLIPWTVSIDATPGEKRPQDEVLAELEGERPAILRWLLEGLADWQADHHWQAEEVRAATEAYRQEQDRLGGFLADRCELGERYAVLVASLYEAYTAWCAGAGEEAVGKQQFGKLLRNRGIDQYRESRTGDRKWRGIRLLPLSDKVSNSSSEKKVIAKRPENLSESGIPVEGESEADSELF